MVYPNSGEIYNEGWHGGKNEISSFVKDWFLEGVRMFGGCCRTNPGDILSIKKILMSLVNAEKK